MSLHPQVLCPIPEETARVARAAYPKGNIYLRIRDELGTIYKDESFADLFPHCGQLAEAPWRLLLVCLMQFAEGLSDQQAAEAVRGRLDWKYMLSLDLTDPGFDASVLCEFRQRLLEGKADQLILQPLLDLARARGWRNRARETADGLNACIGSHSNAQSARNRWGNDAGDAQCAGNGGTRVAAPAGLCRMG